MQYGKRVQACCLREEDRELAHGWLPVEPFDHNTSRPSLLTTSRRLPMGALQRRQRGGSSGAANGLSSNLRVRRSLLCNWKGRAELDDHMKHRDRAFSLAGEIERKLMANSVSVASMTPAKLSGETSKALLVVASALPRTTARSTAFPLEAPFRHSPEHHACSQAAN